MNKEQRLKINWVRAVSIRVRAFMRMTYKKRDFARQLRQDQTLAEEKVWALLRNRQCLGLKFRRQHVVEGFVVDFYCPGLKLAIELDGGIHNKQKDYDKFRQEEIESKFNTVIRVKNEELLENCDVLLNKIREALSPLPLGEGIKG